MIVIQFYSLDCTLCNSISFSFFLGETGHAKSPGSPIFGGRLEKKLVGCILCLIAFVNEERISISSCSLIRLIFFLYVQCGLV